MPEEKHPHERGEDWQTLRRLGIQWETPPRAWGRLLAAQRDAAGGGNTPTSVGKTTWRGLSGTGLKKHPHERGEDTEVVAAETKRPETPPRAWGRRG